MSPAHTAALGVIAGGTILLGLPLARLRVRADRTRQLLASTSIGILVFLLWDVLTAAIEPVEHALDAGHEHGTWGEFSLLSLLLTAGFGSALFSLSAYESWIGRGRASARADAQPAEGAGSGTPGSSPGLIVTAGQRSALLIAVGIGVHNFAEGLAIGQSAAAGATDLAIVLVVGFALHNATEGFGIIGPTAGDPTSPSWKLLGLLGLIGGGPTFLGTLLGQAVVSDALSVAFLALAAGSILYVVLQLGATQLRAARSTLLHAGLTGGLMLGLGTDFFLDVAGG